jgi:hypothetical protein
VDVRRGLRHALYYPLPHQPDFGVLSSRYAVRSFITFFAFRATCIISFSPFSFIFSAYVLSVFCSRIMLYYSSIGWYRISYLSHLCILLLHQFPLFLECDSRFPMAFECARLAYLFCIVLRYTFYFCPQRWVLSRRGPYAVSGSDVCACLFVFLHQH